jgi:hypothetical protein
LLRKHPIGECDRRARTHASPPLFSSPSPSPAPPLPLRPARGDSDVNQGTTVYSCRPI